MRRLNLGCGSMIFEGWDNCDINIVEPSAYDENGTHVFQYDIRKVQWNLLHRYDYIFCNHMLSNFSYHELPDVLANIRLLLNPETPGVVHILVPDAIRAFEAYVERDPYWFPQGDDMSSVDERLCTFLTWFGESKTVFSEQYLLQLGDRAGFSNCETVEWGKDEHDDRKGECIVAEFTR